MTHYYVTSLNVSCEVDKQQSRLRLLKSACSIVLTCSSDPVVSKAASDPKNRLWPSTSGIPPVGDVAPQLSEILPAKLELQIFLGIILQKMYTIKLTLKLILDKTLTCSTDSGSSLSRVSDKWSAEMRASSKITIDYFE